MGISDPATVSVRAVCVLDYNKEALKVEHQTESYGDDLI